MGEFKPTEILQISKSGIEQTEEELYWQNWNNIVDLTEGSAVADIDLCRSERSICAFACASKVVLYDCASGNYMCNVGKFNYSPLCASLREDGQLIAVSDESNCFRVFNLSTLTALRFFKGHESSVRSCKFTKAGYHLASFSDDFTVKFWDLATASQLHTFRGHEDSVRSGICRNDDLIISGSYDHTVRFWDGRQSEELKNYRHDCPIESIALSNDLNTLITAGGSSVAVWDVRMDKKVNQFSRHHKTVTRVQFCSNDSRFMSASLDHHLKIYDSKLFTLVGDVRYSDPILSFSILSDNSLMAVGTSTGRVLIQNRVQPAEPSRSQRKQQSVPQEMIKHKKGFLLKRERRRQYELHDKLLVSFQYHKLICSIVKPPQCYETPEVTVTLFVELIRRGVLTKALTNLPEETVVNLLSFIISYVRHPQFMLYLLEVAPVVIDIYGSKLKSFPPIVKEKFLQLRGVLQENANSLKESVKMVGILESALMSIDAASQMVDNNEAEIAIPDC